MFALTLDTPTMECVCGHPGTGTCTCPVDEAAELEVITENAREAEHQAWLFANRWTF